jgi:hypothetical protein
MFVSKKSVLIKGFKIIMKKKYTLVLLVALSVVLLSSCSKNGINRFILLFEYEDSTNFSPTKIYVKDDFTDDDLNKSFTFEANGKMLEKGNFESGIKTGDWLYNDFKKSDIKIEWKIKAHNDLLISLPSNINYFPSKEFYFLSFCRNADSLNNFFIIFKNETNGSEKIEDYWRLNTHYSLEDSTLKFYHCFELIADNKKIYLSKYLKLEGEKYYNYYSLILEHKEDLYEFCYKSLSGNEVYDYFILFEIIRNTKIADEKVFNYVVSSFDMKDISEQSYKENK